jgi:hypothetical protein
MVATAYGTSRLRRTGFRIRYLMRYRSIRDDRWVVRDRYWCRLKSLHDRFPMFKLLSLMTCIGRVVPLQHSEAMSGFARPAPKAA